VLEALIGTTIRFEVDFADWQGNLVDPAESTLRIRDATKIIKSYSLVKTATGKYYADVWVMEIIPKFPVPEHIIEFGRVFFDHKKPITEIEIRTKPLKPR